MDKANHHYVPQFYLRNFSTDKKRIGMLINNGSQFIGSTSIKHQAKLKHLYGADKVIEDVLAEVEGSVSTIITSIIRKGTLPEPSKEEYMLLLFFMLVSEARVAQMADSSNNMLNETINTSVALDPQLKEHGLSLQDFIDNPVKYSVPNLLSLQIVPDILPYLLDLKLALLYSNNDRTFLTSDNPIIRYNKLYIERNYSYQGYGIINTGFQMFFPISTRFCVYLYDDAAYHSKLDGDIINIDKGKQIDELNKLIYLNSYRFIYFNTSTRENYIQKIINDLKHNNDIKQEIRKYNDEKGIFVHYQKRKVAENIKMPWLNIEPHFLTQPLPSNMAGPIRPSIPIIEKKFGLKR